MKKIMQAAVNISDDIGLFKQLAREFLLLESSDWQFLISTFNARDYAELRFNDHLNRFRRLCQMARQYIENKSLSQEDLAFLDESGKKDALFEDIDIRDFV